MADDIVAGILVNIILSVIRGCISAEAGVSFSDSREAFG